MFYIWSNFATSTLAAAIDPTQTVIQLVNASKFPQPAEVGEKFIITVGDEPLNPEIMLCTSRSGGLLTVVRGYDQTMAKGWAGGSMVKHGPTAEAFRWLSRAALDFNRRFIGFAPVEPSTDGNGDPLLPGAFYYNTVSAAYRSWDGHQWVDSTSLPIITVPPGQQVNVPGTTYTISTADAVKTLRFTSDLPVLVTVPGNIATVMQTDLFQGGNGIITVQGDGSSTLESPNDRDLKHRSTAGRGMTMNLWMDENVDGAHAHWWVRGETQITEGAT